MTTSKEVTSRTIETQIEGAVNVSSVVSAGYLNGLNLT